MSSISIIGLGNMAGALAERALAGGNIVEIIGRDRVKAERAAAALHGAIVGAVDSAPAGAHVVKAFNTLPSDVLAAGSVEGRPVDVFIAGDDALAKARVATLIESMRLRPMGAGQLPMARALENATLLQLGLIAHSVKPANLFLKVSV